MKNEITMIPIGMLVPHPDNPRKNTGDISNLANSIKQSGVMQNLTVVPYENKFRVIIGHRRLAAAKEAGLKELPCVISNMNFKEQCATMLAENMQRVDLTPNKNAFDAFRQEENLFFSAQNGEISFYAKSKKQKAEPLKKSEKEIAANKVRAKLAKLTQQAFELRKAFFDEFNTYTAENEKIIEEAIVIFLALKIEAYSPSDYFFMKKCIEPFKAKDGYCAVFLDAQKWFFHNKKKAKFQLLYALMNDNAKNGFYFPNAGETMPQYKKNENLQAEYNVLAELGYKISTEEMALITGTHEAFGGAEND